MMIDLRSDTFTRPTPAMREAMARAEVGDDCFGEDPTVRALERRAAELLGKEAALFFPSGIMANQAGIMALAGERGGEVVTDARAHLIHYEEGSVAAHGGMTVRGLAAAAGLLTPDELRSGLRPPSPYHPLTRILSLENTHLDSGGRALSPEGTDALAEVARRGGLRVHLDGARIWNAAVAMNVPPGRLAASADTVMASLSKGLGAPVGSVLAGAGNVVERAWRIRRRLGGQMRQAGIVAAGGLYALAHHLGRLDDDHRRARTLAAGVEAVPGVSVVPPETNVVMIDVRESGREVEVILAELKKREVFMVPFGSGRIRAVLHLDVDDAGVERTVAAFREAMGT